MTDTNTNNKPSTNLDSIYSSYEIQRLSAIQRLLLGLSIPGLADQAASLGYTSDEHALGWSNLATASGWDVPFHYHLSEVHRRLALSSSKDMRELYRTLDRFENKWMPRVRNAIRRFVDPAQLETFEAAFFQDLSQQPEGPAVVGSVRLLLSRVEEMPTSEVPGVSDAFDSLESKGLTPAERSRIRDQLTASQQPQPDPDSPAVSPEEIAASAAARRAAYERLNLWYIDWAEIFRAELDYQSQVRLGLVRNKGGRGRSAKPNDDTQPTPPAPPTPVIDAPTPVSA